MHDKHVLLPESPPPPPFAPWRAAGRISSRAEQQQLILDFGKGLPPKAVLWLSFRYNLRQGLSGFYRRARRSWEAGAAPAVCAAGKGLEVEKLAASAAAIQALRAAPTSALIRHPLLPFSLCRSNYTLADGKQRSLATTQFEAASARLAFPCFDEPAFKVGGWVQPAQAWHVHAAGACAAPYRVDLDVMFGWLPPLLQAIFDVEVIAPAGLTVLSNSPPRGVHEVGWAPEPLQALALTHGGLQWRGGVGLGILHAPLAAHTLVKVPQPLRSKPRIDRCRAAAQGQQGGRDAHLALPAHPAHEHVPGCASGAAILVLGICCECGGGPGKPAMAGCERSCA